MSASGWSTRPAYKTVGTDRCPGDACRIKQFDLLRYAAGVMETMHLRYFVTGSTATILYGEVRFTNDIDIAQNRLDLGYINKWVSALGVAEVWDMARKSS